MLLLTAFCTFQGHSRGTHKEATEQKQIIVARRNLCKYMIENRNTLTIRDSKSSRPYLKVLDVLACLLASSSEEKLFKTDLQSRIKKHCKCNQNNHNKPFMETMTQPWLPSNRIFRSTEMWLPADHDKWLWLISTNASIIHVTLLMPRNVKVSLSMHGRLT